MKQNRLASMSYVLVMSMLVAAAMLLSACGPKESVQDTAVDYTPEGMAAVIESVRSAEENEAHPVLTSYEESYLFSILGLEQEDMDACAVSVSAMNVQAYGIALVIPAEGREEAVTAGLQGFIDQQMQNFDMYLADQYDIAKNAVLETLPNGVVMMVMCEDGSDVAKEIRSLLT